MTVLTWREQPQSTPSDHATVQARFRALVRDRFEHPKPQRAGRAA